MAKGQGGRRRCSRSRTWMPLVAALVALLTTVGLGRLVSAACAWVMPQRSSVAAPAAAVANQSHAPPGPAGAPVRGKSQ
jgi:hypothetical protein